MQIFSGDRSNGTCHGDFFLGAGTDSDYGLESIVGIEFHIDDTQGSYIDRAGFITYIRNVKLRTTGQCYAECTRIIRCRTVGSRSFFNDRGSDDRFTGSRVNDGSRYGTVLRR